jgi:hypothetical protein
MGDRADPRQRVWRAGRGLRVVTSVSAAFVGLVGLLIVAGSGVPTVVRGVLALVIGAMVWFLLWTVFHPRLVANDAGLLIVGVWRSTSVAWTEIDGLAAGPRGLLITTVGGRRLASRYPQQALIGRAAREVTGAGDAVAYLRERAATVRGTAPTDLQPSPTARREARWELVLLVGLLLPIAAGLTSGFTLYGAHRARTNEIRMHGVPAAATVERVLVDTLVVRYEVAGQSRSVEVACGGRAGCTDFDAGDRVDVRIDRERPDRAVLADVPYAARGEAIAWAVLVLCLVSLSAVVPIAVRRARRG